MTFKVTHVDEACRRRRVMVQATGRPLAELMVMLALGPARYLAVINLSGRAA
ncbi:hypothetical protein [Paucibacter sp. B51]|uniref:hypothetical protein n=1 Tax=Paucibacter sp. B51 TaxID=2993315 RepID=UPI0022EBFE1A|nr:hypothetical protein [Paucibacter sp. B51]